MPLGQPFLGEFKQDTKVVYYYNYLLFIYSFIYFQCEYKASQASLWPQPGVGNTPVTIHPAVVHLNLEPTSMFQRTRALENLHPNMQSNQFHGSFVASKIHKLSTLPYKVKGCGTVFEPSERPVLPNQQHLLLHRMILVSVLFNPCLFTIFRPGHVTSPRVVPDPCRSCLFLVQFFLNKCRVQCNTSLFISKL